MTTEEILKDAWDKAEAALMRLQSLEKCRRELDLQSVRQQTCPEGCPQTQERKIFMGSLVLDHQVADLATQIEAERERIKMAQGIIAAMGTQELLRELVDAIKGVSNGD